MQTCSYQDYFDQKKILPNLTMSVKTRFASDQNGDNFEIASLILLQKQGFSTLIFRCQPKIHGIHTGSQDFPVENFAKYARRSIIQPVPTQLRWISRLHLFSINRELHIS